MFPRSSGILLHPTSLPGRFGVGDLGPAARQFADFLEIAGQRIWQVLPLGPTGYGDSPYQCFSAFAGNPVLISPELLNEANLLTAEDLASVPDFPADEADYERVTGYKFDLLQRAFRRFRTHDSPQIRVAFEEFCAAKAWWLDDFALFMALKKVHGGVAWTQWEDGARMRKPDALRQWREKLRDDIDQHRFAQFLFFEQWNGLKDHAHERGLQIMGDMPIYVAHDSSDVWSHREFFCLRANGTPEKVAGVPPDYFSATGQLWGNPIYRWDAMADNSYSWWVDRFRATFELIDICRLDHFRGFAAYWEVPAGETTAMNGRWVPGPGAALFSAVQAELGELPIIAENLGVITPDVEAIRNHFGFPGMAILQFAFGNDPQAPDFKPHNYPRNRVAYTGTHDNDTTIGWWNSTGESDSTRTAADVAKEKAFARTYLNTDGREINWVLIRTLLASVADVAVVPLQDVLGLGSEARMNLPGSISGNWRWRFRTEMLKPEFASRLRELVNIYDR
jgi:4-alpha-glucanotransferase